MDKLSSRPLSYAQHHTLTAVQALLARNGGHPDLLPVSLIAHRSRISETATKYALRWLTTEGFIRRTYRCASCGENLGESYGSIIHLVCPGCGQRLSKRVWSQIDLLPRGQTSPTVLSVDTSHVEGVDHPPLPQEAVLFAGRVIRVLQLLPPSGTEALKALLRKEWTSHTCEQWELALMRCYSRFQRKNTFRSDPVRNVSSVFHWAFEEMERQQQERSSCEDLSEFAFRQGRVRWYLEALEGLERQAPHIERVRLEQQRLLAMEAIEEARREFPTQANVFDVMVAEAGRLPRTLLRPGGPEDQPDQAMPVSMTAVWGLRLPPQALVRRICG